MEEISMEISSVEAGEQPTLSEVTSEVTEDAETVVISENSVYQYLRLFTSRTLIELSDSSWSRSKTAKGDVQPYLRGCKWSPDGTCCLTVVNNDGMHVTELSRDLYTGNVAPNRIIDVMDSVIHVKEAGLIYDFCWFPLMNSTVPETCCWLTTRQNAPVQMWDAFDGSLRCSYRGFNAVDQMEPALSVTFTPDGSRIIAGYKKFLRTFDVERNDWSNLKNSFVLDSPFIEEGYKAIYHQAMNNMSRVTIKSVAKTGEQSTSTGMKLRAKARPGRDFAEHKITSAASCFATCGNLLAVGSWNTSISLYNISEMGTYKSIGKMHGHSGGVTHVKFAPDGLRLVSGARKDHRLLVWDIRYYRKPLNILSRVVDTNQRIYFDISPCGKYLVTGGTDGVVKVWDEDQISWNSSMDTMGDLGDNATYKFPLHQDCCNSISIHPLRPILATGSGQYHLTDPLLSPQKKSNETSGEVIQIPKSEGEMNVTSECVTVTEQMDTIETTDDTQNVDMKYSDNSENSLVFWWIGEVPELT